MLWGMEALLAKRAELVSAIRQAQADVDLIDRAIELVGCNSPKNVLLFRRGHLQRLVCDARRAGYDHPKAITEEIFRVLDWEHDAALFLRVRMGVKEVLKRLRKRERDMVRMPGE